MKIIISNLVLFLFSILKKIFAKIFRFFNLIKKNPNKIIIFIKRYYLNLLWQDQKYILTNLKNSNLDFYKSNFTIRELEHQVGRYLNMKKIVNEVKKEKIDGDILEFGTYQGLGLLMLNLCFEDNNRKFIGIDSFEGLPHSSTVWEKGAFHDTSMQLTFKNIAKNSSNIASFKLIKGWFNDKFVSDSLYKCTNNLCIVHFDADLYSSTITALKIIEPYLKNRKKPIFFLFDDWGCNQDEVPEAFFDWLSIAQTFYNFQIKKVSTTKMTRYYKLTFNL
jgi:hypothetical protein